MFMKLFQSKSSCQFDFYRCHRVDIITEKESKKEIVQVQAETIQLENNTFCARIGRHRPQIIHS